MKPVTKADWITALRSGEYQQTVDNLRLRDENAFCCLGVLADLAGIEWETYYEENGRGYEHEPERGYYLSEDVYRAIPATLRSTLVDMNDVMGMSFTEIADVIEKDTTLPDVITFSPS